MVDMARKLIDFLLACATLHVVNCLLPFAEGTPPHILRMTSTEPPGRSSSFPSALPADVGQEEDEPRVEEDVWSPGSYSSLRYHMSDLETTYRRLPTESRRFPGLLRDVVPGVLMIAALLYVAHRAGDIEDAIHDTLGTISEELGLVNRVNPLTERPANSPPAYADWGPEDTVDELPLKTPSGRS
uniref:Transmembrane protein n=1 Tax=Neospora caninum (strain Liverpool) TaxID=572307 RepID=A0A0F7UJZ1_NEOCL|nr:TPA: hypothetical protein BN1204_050775 [Neospora caninum Liverpool]